MKNFEAWNQIKQILDISEQAVLFFKTREIWFMALGENVGQEQNGTGEEFLRPVLVLKKFNKSLFWGVPCTSKKKSGTYYFDLGEVEKRQNTLILSQMRLLDAKRLKYRLGVVDKITFSNIQKSLKQIIDEA